MSYISQYLSIKLIPALISCGILFLPQCGGKFDRLFDKNITQEDAIIDDTTADDQNDSQLKPVITTFVLTSSNPTTSPSITFTIETQNDSDVKGWLINESSTNPQADDTNWQTGKPGSYTITADYNTKTVYAWIKNTAGIISDPVSFQVTYNYGGGSSWNAYAGNFTTYSNEAKALAIDSYDNVYVVGMENNTDIDWRIKKYFPDGTEDPAWNKLIDSNNGHDAALAIAIDSQNHVYVAGYGTNLVSIASGIDWWIKKFSSDGTEDLTWNKTIDSGNGDDIVYSLAIDSSDNVYAAGYASNYMLDWWIKKFSSDGTEYPAWNKQFDSGSYGDDRIFSIAIDFNDDVYVAGRFQDTDSNCAVKKYSSAGIAYAAWDKIFDSGNGDDQCFNVTIDYANNVYLIGTYHNGTDIDWWIKKFSSDGTEDPAWNKIIDSGNGNDIAYHAAVDSQNNLYVAGSGTDLIDSPNQLDWWIKKFSPDGAEYPAWNLYYNGTNVDHDQAHAVAVDSQDNVYIAGYVRRTTTDWWILKLIGN